MADHVITHRGRFEPLVLQSQDGETVYEFGFWTDESADWSIKKVSKPVERGSDITDHARRELAKLTLQVGLDDPEQLAGLRVLMESFAVVDVVAGLAVHTSMMITGIKPTQSMGFAIEAQVQFEEYRAAESRTVQIPEGNTTTKGRGRKRDPGKEEEDDAKEKLTGESKDGEPRTKAGVWEDDPPPPRNFPEGAI